MSAPNSAPIDWRKSTRSSDPDLAQCVQVGVTWIK